VLVDLNLRLGLTGKIHYVVQPMQKAMGCFAICHKNGIFKQCKLCGIYIITLKY